ncbi:MAG: hypothetical protein RL186_27 [Pseudomonadota bacterium]
MDLVARGQAGWVRGKPQVSNVPQPSGLRVIPPVGQPEAARGFDLDMALWRVLYDRMNLTALARVHVRPLLAGFRVLTTSPCAPRLNLY